MSMGVECAFHTFLCFHCFHVSNTFSGEAGNLINAHEQVPISLDLRVVVDKMVQDVGRQTNFHAALAMLDFCQEDYRLSNHSNRIPILILCVVYA